MLTLGGGHKVQELVRVVGNFNSQLFDNLL